MKVSLEAKIRERVKREGPISFADFMEMALYDPDDGYYSSISIGQDYYTSPCAHPVFGALLAIQLEEIWFLLGQPAHFPLVEFGAGRGLLGKDIQGYASYLSTGFVEALDYIPVEKLWGSLPGQPIEGCFLSNELLDALPTHIVVQTGGRLREVMVDVDGDSFVEVLGEPLPGVAELFAEELGAEPGGSLIPNLGLALSEGYRTEVNLEASGWISKVAECLKKGVILTIDYGYMAKELYAAERRRGTLLCYYRHTCNEEPLRRVGCQDITSHVEFTSVIRAGEKAGLRCDGIVAQREFLANLGIQDFIRALGGLGLPTPEYEANLYAMQELIRPEGMGSFRVLVQSRGLEKVRLRGLHSEDRHSYREAITVPRLSSAHLALYQAKYPSWEQDIDRELETWQVM